MTSEESLNNAEHLLARLEAARVRLDETQDPDQAIEILQELAELAKEVEGRAPAREAGGRDGGRRAARGDAAGCSRGLSNCARSSRRTSTSSR